MISDSFPEYRGHRASKFRDARTDNMGMEVPINTSCQFTLAHVLKYLVVIIVRVGGALVLENCLTDPSGNIFMGERSVFITNF